MNNTRPRRATICFALLSAGLVLFGATFAAQQVLSSKLYTQSRLIRRIVQQEQIQLADMASNRRNLDLLLQFAGAVTSAYIDFELIPINEANTFAVIFDSLPGNIEITHFDYQRKDLIIEGISPDPESVEAFRAALEESAYFAQVNGEVQGSDTNNMPFRIECIAQSRTEEQANLKTEL